MKRILFLAIILLFANTLKSQNVGIGTTTPSHKLHILETTSTDPLRIQTLQGYVSENNFLVIDPTSGVVRYMPLQNLKDSVFSDTLFLDSIVLSKFDTLYTLIADSLLKDTLWINTLDSIISSDTIYFNDSSYTLIRDSLLRDSLFLDSLVSLIGDSIDTDIDSMKFINDTLYLYEDNQVLTTYINIITDTALIDSLILSKTDTLYSIISDSLLKDTLWVKQLDSLLSIYGDTIYFNDTSYTLIRDSLLKDSLFLDSLISLIGDSINTDVDSAHLVEDTTLIIYEGGTPVITDIRNIRDSSEWIDGKFIGLTPGIIYARKALQRMDTVVVDNMGYMGIGTSIPSHNLQVIGTSRTDSLLVNQTNLNDNTGKVSAKFGRGNNKVAIWATDNSSANSAIASSIGNAMISATNYSANNTFVGQNNNPSAISILTGRGATYFSSGRLGYFAMVAGGTSTKSNSYVSHFYNQLSVGASNTGFLSTGQHATPGQTVVDHKDFVATNYTGITNGIITNRYGLFIDFDSVGITNPYGVYQNKSGVPNYFAGNVGIGTTTPSNSLHIVSSSGTDPIRIEDLQLWSTGTPNFMVVDTSNGVVKFTPLDSLINIIADSLNTDNQNIDSVTLTGNILTVYIENGTSANVDLSSLTGSGTDDQNLDSLKLNGTILEAFIEGGDSASVDLSILQDGTGTDDQNIDSLTLTGTVLTTYIESGTSANINLQPIIDSALAHQDSSEWEKGSLHGDADTVIYAVRAKTSGNNIRAYTNGDFDVDRHYMKDDIVFLTDEPNLSPLVARNLAVGKGALSRVTSSSFNGLHNTAVGYMSMNRTTTGGRNTAVGYLSLSNNTTGGWNTAFGENSLLTNTTGVANTALGTNSMNLNTTGRNNTSIGDGAMFVNTTGSWNIAVGDDALRNQGNGSYNIGIGIWNLPSNSGSLNISIGDSSLYSNTSGSRNISLGRRNTFRNTTGSSNQSIGDLGLYNNLSGNNNIAFWDSTLFLSTTGSNNIAIGKNALARSVEKSNNIAIGNNAFNGVLDGTPLTFTAANVNFITDNFTITGHGLNVGETYLLKFTTTGTAPSPLVNGNYYYFNVVDANTLFCQTNVSTSGTGSHALVPNIMGTAINAVAIGNNSQPTKSNQIALGDSNIVEVRTYGSLIPGRDGTQNIGSGTERWNTLFATNGTINTSDKRLKTNINELNYGLETVLKMNAVSYNWKQNDNGVRLGFIAQELQTLVPEVVNIANDKDSTLGVRYNELIPVLTKAIQEQQEIINELRKDNQELKRNEEATNSTLSDLTNKLEYLEQLIKKNQISEKQ